MKNTLRKLFSPLLDRLEQGEEPYSYQPSHRKILIVMGVMFCMLATAIVFLAQGKDPAYLFPALVFGATGFIGLVVGLLGEDRAVAKIWGSR